MIHPLGNFLSSSEPVKLAAHGGGGSGRQGGRGTAHEQVVPTAGPAEPQPTCSRERTG